MLEIILQHRNTEFDQNPVKKLRELEHIWKMDLTTNIT